MRGISTITLMFNAIHTVKGGVNINIRVVTKASKTEIAGYDDWKNCFKFKTRELPTKGKANSDILGFFTELFGEQAELVSGSKSRNKLIFIPVPKDEALSILKKFK